MPQGGTCYVIWSRKDRCIVPTPTSNFPTSQAATDASRRIVGKAGNTKDKQGETFDVVQMNI